jgi:hypothetical protein
MTTSNLNLVLRSALALNDMGVSLLKDHCYAQALDTLRDAFSLIKVTATDQQECQSSFGMKIAERIHQQALQRLAQPMPFKRHLMMIEVLTHKQSSGTMRSILQEATRSCTFFPILIEEVDMNGCDSESLGFESALLLHNLGITNLGMSLFSSSSGENILTSPSGDFMLTSSYKTALKYQTKAIGLFRLSHSLCTTAISAIGTCVQYPELLHTLAVVLNSLIEAIQCSNQHSPGKKPLCSELAHRNTIIYKLETSIELFTSVLQTAAPAWFG